MKAGWKTKPLAETCEVFADGDWIESKDQSAEGIRLIQTGNVGEGLFKDRGEKARYISEATFKRLRCTEIFEGDCLVSRLPDPVGRSCLLPDTGERMITAVDCTIIRFNRNEVLPEFFNYCSQSDNYLDTVDSETTGTTRKRISRSKLGLTPILVPPLSEQRRIVGILDEGFEGLATAKANAEQNLQNARALFESHLQAVFTQRGHGWVEKRIPDVCLTFGRGKSRHRPRNERSLYGGDYPFIQTGDLSNADHVVTTYSKTYNDKGLAQSKLWPKGTVGIAIVGATIGESGVLGFDACFPDSVIGMTVNPTIADPFFLEYMLQHFKDRVKSQGEGSARENINIGTFDTLLFPVPPVSEQRRIVERVDGLKNETQRLESLYQRKRAALDELKKSLLHRAFSGQL